MIADAEDTIDDSCPCVHTTPCDERCTCVSPASSVGCVRCCRYGSDDQRRVAAERLARMPAEIELLRAALEANTFAFKEHQREVDRLSRALHQHFAHPDFEYLTTQTARKNDPLLGRHDERWEANNIVESHERRAGVVVKECWRNWERHELYEDNYWRRKR